MKRVAFFLALIMVLGIAVVNAEIRQLKDDFSGSTKIVSYTALERPVDSLSLIKITGTNPKYSVFAKLKSSKEFSLVKTFWDLKIDDKVPVQLDVRVGGVMVASDNRYMIVSSATVDISDSLINDIKNAERVALRFQTEGGYTPVYVLPDAVLAEWKEVINTEK